MKILSEFTHHVESVRSFGTHKEKYKKVETHQVDGADGVASALDVRRQYVDAMSQLRDRKTRDIALRDVYRLDLKIDQIKQAASVA